MKEKDKSKIPKGVLTIVQEPLPKKIIKELKQEWDKIFREDRYKKRRILK